MTSKIHENLLFYIYDIEGALSGTIFIKQYGILIESWLINKYYSIWAGNAQEISHSVGTFIFFLFDNFCQNFLTRHNHVIEYLPLHSLFLFLFIKPVMFHQVCDSAYHNPQYLPVLKDHIMNALPPTELVHKESTSAFLQLKWMHWQVIADVCFKYTKDAEFFVFYLRLHSLSVKRWLT